MVGVDGDEFGLLGGRQAGNVVVRYLVEHFGDGFGGLDAGTKRHGPPHRLGVCCGDGAVVADDLFRQGVDTAHQFEGIIAGDFVLIVAEQGLHVGRDGGFTDGQNQDFVVGEQVAFDRFAEADAIYFAPIEARVVHRAEDGVGFFGFAFGVVAKQTGRGGHIDALGAGNEGIVVDADEV